MKKIKLNKSIFNKTIKKQLKYKKLKTNLLHNWIPYYLMMNINLGFINQIKFLKKLKKIILIFLTLKIISNKMIM